MSNDVLRRSYDAVHYDSRPLPQTHPDRSFALAHLLGLEPTPVTACRVLELGCASGGNLIPMAAQLGGSRFVGIDLSAQQIAIAENTVRALALENIELHAADILDPGLIDRLGAFDYIIAHGLYSWVPAATQQALLPLIARLLSPGGLAYVSYNTYPGWQQRGLVRQYLLTATRGITDPARRAATARAALDALAQNHHGDAAYGAVLESERARVAGYDDGFLLHDLLEPENHPVWFEDFAARAANAGLRHLCESNLSVSRIENFGLAARQALAAIADPVAREQHIDFWLGRTLRESILCHAAQPSTPDRLRDRLPPLWVTTTLTYEANADLSDGIEVFYVEGGAPGGARIGLRAGAAKLALGALIAQAPVPVSVADLCTVIEQPDAVLDLIEALAKRNLVTLSPRPPAFVGQAGPHPTASPLARWQSLAGTRVTSQAHQLVDLTDPALSALLPLLDGTRDHDALAAMLPPGGDPATALHQQLTALARHALLIA